MLRKPKFLLIIFLSFFILSCSDDDKENQNNDDEIKISKWINKRYTFFDSNSGFIDSPILTDSIQYILDNNQIISFSGESNIHDYPKTIKGTVIYENKIISQITSYLDDELVYETNYSYEDGIISEMRSKAKDIQSFFYSKVIFRHTADTIFSDIYESNNDIDYQFVSTSKTVLDENDNKIFRENNNGQIIQSFDNNGNLISSNIYSNTTMYSYSYSDIINSESIIVRNTYGKKTFSLDFGEGSSIFPKVISYNTLSNSNGNNGGNTFEVLIDVQNNAKNHSINTKYIEIENEISRRQEVSEFEIE